MTPFEFGYNLSKQAAHVEQGGPVSRFTANTLGRVLGLPTLLMTGRALHDPSIKGRPEGHKAVADAMTEAEPDALKDTVLRLGGTNLVDDLIWKKERGQDLPWYSQVGGRVWHNPRTTVLGKLVGTVGAPLGSLLTPLTRGSHYNPEADSAAIYADEPAISSHELGHAIDFNKVGPTTQQTGLARFGRALGRDAYRAAYLPVLNLYHEAEANRHSRDALERGMADDPKQLQQLTEDRNRILPAGYGSYIGSAANTLAGGALPFAPLAGMLGGKAYGAALNDAAHASRQKPHPAPAT